MIDLRVPDGFGVTHVTGLEPNAIAGYAQRLQGALAEHGCAPSRSASQPESGRKMPTDSR
jgi:hypothetical protein